MTTNAQNPNEDVETVVEVVPGIFGKILDTMKNNPVKSGLAVGATAGLGYAAYRYRGLIGKTVVPAAIDGAPDSAVKVVEIAGAVARLPMGEVIARLVA